MIAIIIVLIIATAISAPFIVGIVCEHLQKMKEYEIQEADYTLTTLKHRNDLEIAQEKTKQVLLEKEKEAERTKQLEIKAGYKEKTGQSLY